MSEHTIQRQSRFRGFRLRELGVECIDCVERLHVQKSMALLPTCQVFSSGDSDFWHRERPSAEITEFREMWTVARFQGLENVRLPGTGQIFDELWCHRGQ